MPRLKITGAIPPLPCMPSWCAQGQVHFVYPEFGDTVKPLFNELLWD
jgi:hypothetical protein